MYNLEIHKKAKETLDYLKKKNKDILLSIINSLDEIIKKWFEVSNVKNIWDWIFRKRTWRYRILMTKDKKELNKIHIWIIELEKDTKKDYKKWKIHIIKNLSIIQN